MRKNSIILGSVLLGLKLGVTAGEVSFTAEVDRTTLSMNDSLTLQLTLAGDKINLPPPSLPAIPGFQARYAGESQNIQYINGQVSSQKVYTFSLTPQATGDHLIPALTVTVGRQTIATAPISVKVVSGSAVPAPTASSAITETTPPVSQGRPLFVTTSVDKTTATVGEQITLLFRFYSRVQLLSQPNYRPADTTGFMTEDLPPQRQFFTTLGGTRYQVVELATALFPITPGRLTIGPAALECQVQDFRGDPFGGDFFQQFFNNGQRVLLQSDPLTLTVKGVPDKDKPATFRGDVGRFKISAALDKASARVHEPLTLTVTVSGEGNLKSVSSPVLPETKEFKIYETISNLHMEKTDRKVGGSKIFTTIVKPEVSGPLTIPSLSLVYFDPLTHTFKTVASKALEVKIDPADPHLSEPGTSPVPVSEGVKEIGRDIRFIKTRGAVAPPLPPLTQRPWFLWLQILPALLFVGLGATRMILTQGRGKWALSPSRKAQRALKRAALQTPGMTESFHKIFLDYLGAKLKTNPQGLTSEGVRTELSRQGHPEATLKMLESLWNDFDHARYTPTSSAGELPWGERVINVVRALEAKQ